MKNLLLVALLLTIFTSCGDSKPFIRVGEQCLITEKCVGAPTESIFKDLQKVIRSKDETMFNSMILNGSLVILKAYTSAKVLEIKSGRIHVETEDGLRVWVASSYVKR